MWKTSDGTGVAARRPTMPRRPRHTPLRVCFHVTNRSAGRVAIFQRPRDYRAFLHVLADGLERHPLRLVAYALMPNHWHLLVGPTDSSEVSGLLHWVSSTHAVRWHHHRHTVGYGPVYQSRFWSEPLPDPERLVRVCRYIERNALAAGLVRRAQDWPWSSLADRLRPEPVLPIISTPFLVSAAWLEHVNTPSHREEDPADFHN